MTSSILSSPARHGDRLIVADLVVAGSPHPHRAMYAVPFESVAWFVALLLFARRLGEGGQHRPERAGTRVTLAVRRVRRFLKEWWPYLAVIAAFAFVTIVGLLVVSIYGGAR